MCVYITRLCEIKRFMGHLIWPSRAKNHVVYATVIEAQLSNEMGVGFLTIAKSVSCECNFFKIYDYI